MRKKRSWGLLMILLSLFTGRTMKEDNGFDIKVAIFAFIATVLFITLATGYVLFIIWILEKI